jgi:hypothetical protein
LPTESGGRAASTTARIGGSGRRNAYIDEWPTADQTEIGNRFITGSQGEIMVKRGFARAAVAIAAILAMVSVGTPALATDHTFFANYYRDDTGTVLVASVKGDITWLNRSVTLSNVQIWVRGGNCAKAQVKGYAGTNPQAIDGFVWTFPFPGGAFCTQASQWIGAESRTLNGSQVVGGITKLAVFVLYVEPDGDLINTGTTYNWRR